MHPVGFHFGNGRLARGQIELPDRDAEIFPLHRLFFFVRCVHLKILDRDARRFGVHIEVAACEMCLYVGLRAELARRHGSRQDLLRERLQGRQIDLIDRYVGRNLRLRQIQRARHRQCAAAVNIGVHIECRRRLPERLKILYSHLERIERRRRRSRTAVVLDVHSAFRQHERFQLKIHRRFRRRRTRHRHRLLRHIARRRWCGRWSARRCNLRWRTRRRSRIPTRRQRREIVGAVGVQPDIRDQPVDPDRPQVEHRAERLDVAQLHLRMSHCDQRRVGSVANVQLIESHRSVQTNQRLCFRLHEMQIEIRGQRSTRNFDRQLHRRVTDVEREVEPMQFQINYRVARRLEWLGDAGNPQRAPVDHHLHERLHEHIHIRGQVRDKRHVDLNLLNLVLLAEQLIVDRHFAVAQLNIGNRKSLRRTGCRGLRLRGRRRALEQIGKVEFLLRHSDYVDRRLVDHNRTDHRRKSEQRGPRNLHRQMPKIDERLLRIAAFANVQLVEIEFQAIKIEADFADAHLAMDAAGDRSGQHVPQYRRNRDVSCDAQEQNDRGDDDADFAHPPRTPELLSARHPRLARMKRSPHMPERGFCGFARSFEKARHEPDAASVSRLAPIVNSSQTA